jgi:hypothetical protein
MIHRTILVVIGMAVLVSGLALAEELRPRGRPEVLNKGRPSYYIWFDKDGWHLRTTAKEPHRFTGVIEVTEGTFTDLKNASADARTRRAGGDGDRGHISKDKLKIDFGMRTNGDFDGFDFKVSDKTKTLKFDLKIDGDPINQKFILIGAKGQNPENNIFEVPAIKAGPREAAKP